MAEYICRYLRPEIYCESRGVSYEEQGNDMYPPAKRCLENHGIPFGRHSARRIEKCDYDDFDEIYIMDNSNRHYINKIIDDYDNKVRMLCSHDIEDPWWTGNYEKVYEEILEGIENL